jgi:hypothetical protein
MQDFAQQAKDVLGGTVNDSGTPERAATMAMLHVLAGGGAAYGLGAPAVAGMGGLAAAYSPIAQDAFRALAAGGAGPRQGAATAIREISPGITAATIASQPYDNKPRSQREWRAEYQKRLDANQQFNGYYGNQ